MNSLEHVRRLSFFAVLGCAAAIAFQAQSAHPLSASPLVGQAQNVGNAELDSKLAKYYEHYTTLLNFDERIAQAEAANAGVRPEQIEMVKSMERGYQQHLPASAFPANVSPQLIGEVANCDVIVMGVPVTERTLPIQDRSFLFTEYEVRVEEVFFAGQQVIHTGDTIIVSRAGGELPFNGVLVKAIESAFDLLGLNQPYILMLRSVPGTDTYRALGSGTFVIADGAVSIASHLEHPKNAKQQLDSFLSELDAAIALERSAQNLNGKMPD
jgi:hypothetical protein